jgi:hypothetical protein
LPSQATAEAWQHVLPHCSTPLGHLQVFPSQTWPKGQHVPLHVTLPKLQQTPPAMRSSLRQHIPLLQVSPSGHGQSREQIPGGHLQVPLSHICRGEQHTSPHGVWKPLGQHTLLGRQTPGEQPKSSRQSETLAA